jgi:hypothetical protein
MNHALWIGWRNPTEWLAQSSGAGRVVSKSRPAPVNDGYSFYEIGHGHSDNGNRPAMNPALRRRSAYFRSSGGSLTPFSCQYLIAPGWRGMPIFATGPKTGPDSPQRLMTFVSISLFFGSWVTLRAS